MGFFCCLATVGKMFLDKYIKLFSKIFVSGKYKLNLDRDLGIT